MLCLWTVIVLLVPLFFLLQKDKPQIFGIYSQRGRWYYLKYAIFSVIFHLRRWRMRNEIVDYNALEKPQILSSDPKGFDAIFFVGVNSDGYKFVFGCERRHKGLIHTVLYFVIPGKGLFHLPIVPDTCSQSTSDNKESTEYKANGMHAFPVSPMKSWKTLYDGPLRSGCCMYKAKFEAEFISDFKAIDFNKDLNPHLLISAIATEEWSREYFTALKDAHQNRYEQIGKIVGKLTIDDNIYDINLQGFRDHGYGHKRDWSLMHRYAYFILFLDNGYSMSIGIICQPCTGSRLKLGYVVDPKGNLTAVDWCDFELYTQGECGSPPKDHAFRFSAGNTIYVAEIVVEHESVHYVGSNWEGRMVERFVNCKINGISGSGVSEFNYRNKLGKSEEATINDSNNIKQLKLKNYV